MERSLGLTALRLPGSLEQLAATPLFAAAAAEEQPPDLTAWLQAARQQTLTQLDWAVVLRAFQGQLQASQALQLASLLSWAAKGARQQLEEVNAGTAAADAGDPRRRQALQNSLKLSLFFLCSLARGEGTATASGAQHPHAAAVATGGQQKRAKAAGGDGAAAALAALRLRRDALLAAGGIEEAVAADRALLPAVSDLRAACRLVRAAVLHCLVHPLPVPAGGGDRSAKDLAEACFQAVAGILARPFVAAEAHAAAAQTLQDLLAIVCQPKQQTQVLTGVARLVSGISQQSSRASVAIASRLAERLQSLAAQAGAEGGRDAGAAALAGQQLDACLQFAAMLAAAPGASTLPAALLLSLPTLLPLLRQPSSSTRRLALDLCGTLLPIAARLPSASTASAAAASTPDAEAAGEPAEAAGEPADLAADGGGAPQPVPQQGASEDYRQALLAAVVSRLNDKDATLRAKALGVLEKHARLAATCLGSGAGAEAGAGGALQSPLLSALCGRLCDKSVSVRKKAVALLVALLHPSAGLAPAGAAALAVAALPVAAKLLGVKADSALHPGHEASKVLSRAVLQMAGSATSAAVVPRLLQLARGSAEPACKEQLPAAVLDLLLPASAPSATAAAHVLLQNLGMALQQCSRREAEQLHAAVQSRLAEAGPAAQAAVACAVQLCYQRLTARLSAGSEQAPAAAAAEEAAGAAEGAAADGPSADAAGTAVALFVLGPFSSPGEAESCMAEARLLLRCLEQLAAPPDSTHGASSAAAAAPTAWLLSCLTLAWQQLAPTCLAPPSAGSQPSQLAAVAGGAVCGAALAAATLRSLHGLLLSPCCTPDVRRRCLEAAFALPPAAQGPLRLLQALTAAAGTDQPAAGCAGLAPAGAAPLLQLDEDDELRIHPAAGSVLGEAASLAEEGGAGEEGHSASGAVAEAAAGRRQLEQQHGLVALLDLLGGLASTYERHKVDFLQQLSAGPGQQHQQQSRAGRPLRPAAEWWVGGGAGEQRPHEAGGELERPAAAASADGRASQPGGAASEDYMGAEDEAAKHEAAAQLYVESLLDAADTAPACYLPLLERLAREAGDAAPAAVQASFGGISMLQLRTCNRLQQGPEPLRILAHSFLQAAALRALGRLALLSQPLSARAVALAERALQPSAGAGPGSRAATEVQQAAVSVLAEAISAFPNSHSDRLLLIGQLMVPLPGEPGPARAGGSAGSCEAAEGAAGEGGDGDGSAAARERQQQEQLARCAAAAYCRLLLHNRLKLQGMLGPVGVALARGAPPVAALVRHALRQLLLAGAPKERARLAMALFHQTPLACRLQLAEALTDPASGLLADADRRGDVLVSQALQALLAAAGSDGGAGAASEAAPKAVAAAVALLRAMQPSAKVLSGLQTQLQAGGGGASLLSRLQPAARQALRAFVSSHLPAAGGRDAGEAEAAGAEPEPAAAGGGKRKRASAAKGSKSGSSAVLQQHLLGLLAGGAAGGSRHVVGGRPPRPTSTFGGATTSLGATTTAGVRTNAASSLAGSAGGRGEVTPAGEAPTVSRRRQTGRRRRRSTAAATVDSSEGEGDSS